MQCWKQNLASLQVRQVPLPIHQPLRCENFAISQSRVVGSQLRSRESKRILAISQERKTKFKAGVLKGTKDLKMQVPKEN